MNCVRTALLMGRRYESFPTGDDWRAFHDGWASRLSQAARFAERAGLVVGLENHKDFLADELAAMVNAVASPAIGVCFDFGNNMALLEDPAAVLETLAPNVVTTHVKDIAVRATDEGLEMSEVPLGEGQLPLAQFIDTLRRARPGMRFFLEMITRDPLKVPCMTRQYWEVFPERNGRYLAQIFKLVQAKASGAPLPTVDHLSREERAKVEEDNVRACLRYVNEKMVVA